MYKKMVITAGIFAFLAVLLGAFGAHGLKSLVSEQSARVFEVGVRYQMYHALAMLFIGTVSVIPYKTKKLVFGFFTAGILLFSGSLYLLALDAVLGFEVSRIGFVTPVGGLLFLTGWLVFIVGVLKHK